MNKITFTRKTTVIIAHTYSIRGKVLTRVDRVKDLGIVFDQEVTFIPQIVAVMRKAKRLAVFLNRNTGIFGDQGGLFFALIFMDGYSKYHINFTNLSTYKSSFLLTQCDEIFGTF